MVFFFPLKKISFFSKRGLLEDLKTQASILETRKPRPAHMPSLFLVSGRWLDKAGARRIEEFLWLGRSLSAPSICCVPAPRPLAVDRMVHRVGPPLPGPARRGAGESPEAEGGRGWENTTADDEHTTLVGEASGPWRGPIEPLLNWTQCRPSRGHIWFIFWSFP